MPPQTLTAQATADATGKATWTFPLVTRGQWWHVAGIVPTAPTAAKFTLRVNGANRFSWLGPLPGAAVVVTQGSSVSITGTGLVADHTYAALLTGSWHVGEAVGVPPQGPSSFSQTSVKITGGTVKITGPVTISSGTVTAGVTGGQLTKTGVPLQYTSSQFPNTWLGSGADGTVTLSANTTLTRDMQYEALTIDAGVTLSPHGYRIRCRGAVTVKGTITASGSNGSNSTATAGGAGGAGAPGGTQGGGAGGGAGGAEEAVGLAGDSVAATTLGGGAGGAGGANSADTYVGGAGGSGGKAPSAFPTVTTVTTNVLNGGGGGGGGGGVVLIICTSLVVTGGGSIVANGGNGGSTYIDTGGAQEGGSGGGGGGGEVLILCRSTSGVTASNVTALGGAGGTFSGTGARGYVGATGSDGYVTILVTG